MSPPVDFREKLFPRQFHVSVMSRPSFFRQGVSARGKHSSLARQLDGRRVLRYVDASARITQGHSGEWASLYGTPLPVLSPIGGEAFYVQHEHLVIEKRYV